MKLNARDALAFCRSPDRRYRAVLIYGEDAVEVSRRRGQLLKALVGDGGDQNVTHVDVALARREPAQIADAMRSRGFFGGEPIVVIENGTDGLAAGLADVLKGSADDEAFLIVTAGSLPARSKLRKLFESDASVVAAPCYEVALGPGDVDLLLKEAGVTDVSDEVIRDLVDFCRGADRGALTDLISRLALYTLDGDSPVSSADLIACLPGSGDANLEDVLDAVANGEADKIGPIMTKLEAQGVNATTLALSMARKFRQLYAIAAAGGSADAAISRLRPPVFGPRRDALARQARIWSTVKCEGALRLMLETDSGLRGGEASVGYPLLERVLIRLALGARR